MHAPDTGGGLTVADLRRERLEEPWEYYDTRMIGAATWPGDSAAFNFAQLVSPIPFFSSRSVNNGGVTLTNMSDLFKTDEDFLCDAVSIDVQCATDADSASSGIAVAMAFVETITYYGIVTLKFGTNVKMIAPVVKFPSGGGVVTDAKTRTQGANAFSDSQSANNGIQGAYAKNILGEQIFFPAGTAFTMFIELPTDLTQLIGPLHRVQNLPPLTGDLTAMIRVNLEGTRGRRVAAGFPAGNRGA